ncbi:MAG: phosphotransferase [Oligoflexia bacterium]|nr:phosphotransferase [Oligoflexia bacterium]
MNKLLQSYLEKWNLTSPTEISSTRMSTVYKVTYSEKEYALKLLTEFGKEHESMSWIGLKHFNGHGAVNLIKHDEGALLIDYVDGQTLKAEVTKDNDKEVAFIVCDVLKRIHSNKEKPNEDLWDLKRQFKSLFDICKEDNTPDYLHYAKEVILELLETETEKRVLHGDVHHTNILFCNQKNEWLVIDPQPLYAERTYDIANTFYNPDNFPEVVESTERINYLSEIYSKELDIPKERVLKFALAHGALSVSWQLEMKEDPSRRVRILKLLLSKLKQ